MRDTIGTTIYFTTYESTKQLLVKFQGSDSPTSPLSVATAGGFCGLASWACVCPDSGPISSISTWLTSAQIYPIDTAKTHYQRNCLTKAKGQPVNMPKIQFFKLNQYRGEQIIETYRLEYRLTMGFLQVLVSPWHVPVSSTQSSSHHSSSSRNKSMHYQTLSSNQWNEYILLQLQQMSFLHQITCLMYTRCVFSSRLDGPFSFFAQAFAGS